VRSRGPRAHAPIVHGCAMRHTVEAMPPRRPGLPRLARTDGSVGLAVQPPEDRSIQRLRRRRRWTTPVHSWAARLSACPPSVRQRARTAAAPCPTALPPEGLKKEGTGAAALCPCSGCFSPPHPLQGLCGSLAAPGGQQLRCSCRYPSAVFPPSVQAFGMYCRGALASRPGHAARTRP
jgi:hypothetical protein